MKSTFLRMAFLVIILPVLAACRSESQIEINGTESVLAASPTITPTSTPEPRPEYMEIFEIVWQTVNERFFDPNFNNVDWQAIHDEYQPKIAAAVDDETFYILLNEMCFELGVSHIAVTPPEESEQLEPLMSAPGSLGIEVRLIDEQVVVTSVESGSAAHEAGIHTGYIIKEIDGHPVERSEEWVTLWLPPYNERRYHGQIISVIMSKFYGEVGQDVTISYLDAKDQLQEISITMREREEEAFDSDILPTLYVELESERLENGIGYIRLTGFLPPILDDFKAVIKDMQDAPGVIIDIRGNPGGFYPVRKAITSQFFPERTLLWNYITRPGLELPGFEHEAYTDPPAESSSGHVVILVDALSGSSSEEFAGAMQANNRATIIGERTAGADLVGDFITLPNGSLFLYPIAQTQTADGTVLEGRGVIPDIEARFDRVRLLGGIDSQLEAAVEYIKNLLEE